MHWASVVADGEDLQSSLESGLAKLREGLGTDPLDLLMVFPSHDHLFDYGRIRPTIVRNCGEISTFGCSAAAVIGAGVEVEARPAVSLVGAHLPEAEWRIRHLRDRDLPPLDGSPRPWRDLIGVDPAEGPSFLVVADAFTINLRHLLDGLDYAYPEATKVGGLASGASGPGAHALFHSRATENEGALVLVLTGGVGLEAIVSQGCRPVGEAARVSACEGRLLKGLDGKAPSEFLRELFAEASEEDQRLLQHALQIGVLVNEAHSEFHRGGFLIRNIVGMEQSSGVMAVGSVLREGQTIRFHVRDRNAAAHDLAAHLGRVAKSEVDSTGAVLQFCCLGRGKGLFGQPHHDARMVQEHLGPVPAGGFFCNGEIGPISRATYVHGFSAVLALVQSRS